MLDIDNLRVNFESKVLQSGKVILVPHKVADFDAIGSAIGLSLAVSKLKKASMIIVDDKPYELDRGVQAIIRDCRSEHNIVTRSKYLSKAADDDLFVMTDVNKSYLITVADLMKDPERVLILDQHEGDDKTVPSNYQYLDGTMSSASEAVTKLLLKMKIKIPKNIANYLLAGIYLDTNKLTKNIGDETYLIAQKLKEVGADPNYVMELFTEDYDSDRRVQELVSKQRTLVYKIALILAEEVNEYTTKELARTADYALNYDVNASFAVGRISDEIVGVSARSRNSIDIDKAMKQLCVVMGQPNKGGGTAVSGAAKFDSTTVEEVGKKLELILRPSCFVEKKTES